MWGPGSNRGLVSRAVGLAGLQLLQRECHLGGGSKVMLLTTGACWL